MFESEVSEEHGGVAKAELISEADSENYPWWLPREICITSDFDVQKRTISRTASGDGIWRALQEASNPTHGSGIEPTEVKFTLTPTLRCP
jgi:hypothetical protein